MSKRSAPTRRRAACCNALSGHLSPRFFRALGDPNRLALLSRLADCDRPGTVSEIACCCPVDLSVVSRHLGILRNAGIVESERRGKEVHYRLRAAEIVTTLRSIADAIEACIPDEEKAPSGARQ